MSAPAAPPVQFHLKATDGHARARAGTLRTLRGDVPTPLFMPVGTVGSVKGLTVSQLRAAGARLVLGNAYHLALRPGAELIAQLGGLHAFTGWQGPMLTDSGGFQVYSLGPNVQLSEEGVVFRSHVDGARFEMTPESSIAIQEQLGADIVMQLDDVTALPCSPERAREACHRSARWAERCLRARTRPDQALFGIVQGGLDLELRRWSAARLCELGFAGYAIGGLSVGEDPEQMQKVVAEVCPELPADKPRYLMGVGTPWDLLEGVAGGVDMFDCVMPTRNGRNALAFTDQGVVRLRNARHRDDPRPLDATCSCPAELHSRAYLRHLFMAKEMLGPILLSIHNVRYYQRLMERARQAILADAFPEFHLQMRRGWSRQPPSS